MCCPTGLWPGPWGHEGAPTLTVRRSCSEQRSSSTAGELNKACLPAHCTSLLPRVRTVLSCTALSLPATLFPSLRGGQQWEQHPGYLCTTAVTPSDRGQCQHPFIVSRAVSVSLFPGLSPPHRELTLCFHIFSLSLCCHVNRTVDYHYCCECIK